MIQQNMNIDKTLLGANEEVLIETNTDYFKCQNHYYFSHSVTIADTKKKQLRSDGWNFRAGHEEAGNTLLRYQTGRPHRWEKTGNRIR